MSPSFILGADISSVQESSSTFRDTDGQTKSIFALLKNHGFNYIRLKTFVNPTAPYGYASNANGCTGLSQAYGDKAHVVAYGKQAKDHGMGFLLDFHYSDVWADPGNQIIPEAWRSASTIPALAALVKAYTKDVLTTAVNAGARPDMVQIGNEITPGMLMHVPGPDTDCWGNDPQDAPVGGSAENWDDLAALLTAGIEGVREVDPSIQIMLHVENTDDLEGVRWWVDNARSRDVDFDVLGLSCYVPFQGEPSVWQATLTDLAMRYSDLKFVIAEYNPERTQANLIVKNLPGGRGLGTFFWEPTRSGDWGDSMFTFQNGVGVANGPDFAEYDALRPQLGL
jgi:arabinogalactan endo-1,4-beta-galactosidase